MEGNYRTSTRKEIAQKLGVSTKTLSRYLQKKQIDTQKYRRFFSYTETQRILNSYPN
jgi:IS30 family transposase